VSYRRSVLLVFFLIAAAVIVSVAGMVIVALFVGNTPSMPSNAAVYLDIDAPFSEIEPPEVLRQLMAQPPTLRSLVDIVHRAKDDSRVRALVIRPSVNGALWGQIQEVRAALDDFRASGKPIVAYLESGGAGEYYLASAADRVLMMPAGQLDLAGLASYELFFRGALDKIGVFPDMLHIGDYKTASNTFTERGFTAAHREMTQSLNRDWHDELVRAVARGRKIPEDQARAAVDGGPYTAEDAKAAGLVDALAYLDQVDDHAPIQGTHEVEGNQYEQVVASSGGAGLSTDRIALLYAVGTIASGQSSFDAPTGTVLGSDTFNGWLRKVRVDPSVRAVVVRIDSPGGSAIASEVIWRELMLTRDVKPVIVSMGDVAASGGYYIAAPAQTIIAEPGTLTGSIGVVTGKFVVQGALDKLGVGTGAVSDGRFAEINSPFRPFSPEERARVEEQMQTTYELFLSRVAEGRHETTAKVDAIAQGRVWTGRQAREIGLVDQLGGLDDAIRIAKERARLDPRARVDLTVYPPKRSFYDLLANSLGGSTMTSRMGALLERPEARAVESTVSAIRLFRRGEPLALMPNVFVAH
jgi:protease-4